MKKIIPFKKDLVFKTKVSEITSISLEHTMNLANEDELSGSFTITGDYKLTDASINRETFSFQLPFDIVLDSRYNKDNINLDIDDFYYEIIDDNILRVNIDVYLEGNEIIEIEKSIEDTIEDVRQEEKITEEKMEEISLPKEPILELPEERLELEETNLFNNLSNNEEYATYSVYIMKEEDTIEKVMLKYNVTKEALENYNDLSNIMMGDKIIIPSIINE